MDKAKRIEETALIYGSVQGAQDRMPDFATINTGDAKLDENLRNAIISLSIAADRLRESLIELAPCDRCKGAGGFDDCGPNEGCAEFAPCQFIECPKCKGAGYDLSGQ